VIFNVSDPTNPDKLGDCPTPGYAMSLYVQDSLVFVADVDSGLQIINVNDPANPNLAGSYVTQDDARDVFVKDSLAYIAALTSGLLILDFKDPANPDSVGCLNTPGWAYGVFVQDSFAYVADEAWGLQIVNVSDPANPSLVESYNTPGYSWDVFVDGKYDYLADKHSLMIFEFSPGTGVEENSDEEILPTDFVLSQNYPNPFNPLTSIQYTVNSKQSHPVHTTQKSVYGSQFMVHSPIHTILVVYNILGQKVRTLVDEDKLPGEYKVVWDGKDDIGNPVSSGIYFYKFKAGDFSEVKKMLLIK